MSVFIITYETNEYEEGFSPVEVAIETWFPSRLQVNKRTYMVEGYRDDQPQDLIDRLRDDGRTSVEKDRLVVLRLDTDPPLYTILAFAGAYVTDAAGKNFIQEAKRRQG